MELNSQVDHMDEELKLLNSEIKQVLLEIQEGILEVQNPFSGAVVFSPQPPAKQPTRQAAPLAPPEVVAPTTIDSEQTDLTTDNSETQFNPSEFPSEEFVDASSQNADNSRRHSSGSRTRSSRPSTMLTSSPNTSRDKPVESNAGKAAIAEPSTQPALEPDVSDTPGLPPKTEKVASTSASTEVQKDEVKAKDNAATSEKIKLTESDKKPDKPPQQEPAISPFASLSGLQFSSLEGKLKEGSMDLVTIAGLAQWTSNVLQKVGKEHLISLLEVSALTGRISLETREILLGFIPLLEANMPNDQISAKEIVRLLAQLDGFLGTVSKTDTRLLPFLLQENLDVFPLIQP